LRPLHDLGLFLGGQRDVRAELGDGRPALTQKGDFFETYSPFFVANVRDAESSPTLWAKKLTAHERGKRVKWDTETNLASALDPASWPTFSAQAGDWDDVLSHGKMIMRRWAFQLRYVHDGGAGAAGRGGMPVEQGETRALAGQERARALRRRHHLPAAPRLRWRGHAA